MSTNIKFTETGSAPYYLNISNTTKEISNQESTNSSSGLLFLLGKYLLIEDNTILINPQILNNTVIIRV